MDNSNIYIFIPASSLHYKLIHPSAFFRCLVNCLIGISILVFQKWSWFPSPTPRLPTCLFHLSLVNTSSQKLPKSGSHQIYIPPLLLPSHICKSCYFSLQKYLESVQFSPSLCCYPIPKYHHPSHVTPAEPWRQKEKWVHESGWLLWYAHIIWCYMAHSCSSWKSLPACLHIFMLHALQHDWVWDSQSGQVHWWGLRGLVPPVEGTSCTVPDLPTWLGLPLRGF